MSKTKSKVNFSFAKKKKKESKKAKEFQEGINDPNENEFSTIAEAAINETKRRKEEGVDLVIPLGEKDKNGNEPILSGLKRIIHGEDGKGSNHDPAGAASIENNDKEAEDALILMASENQDNKEYQTDSTNFSAKRGPSTLVIKQKDEVNANTSNVDETIKYQRDMKQRAEDISVHSDAYINVPIGEFGAAMLRGMGWKNSGNDDKKDKKEQTFNPRPHRLGLGATPLPPSIKNGGKDGNNKSGKRHYAKKGGTMGDRAKIEQEEEEERRWKKQMEERQQNDIQMTLQVGSVVWVDNEEQCSKPKRAKMVKIAGVPGLNRVLVRYEGEVSDVSVKKSDLELVKTSDLERKPFHEKKDKNGDKNPKKDEEKNDRGKRKCSRERSHSDDGGEMKKKDSKRKEERSRDRKRHRRSEDGERVDTKRRRNHDDCYDSDSKKKSKKSKSNNSSSCSRVSDMSNHHERWLTPNIRVRVVSKKVAKGKQYKQKGIVMDVLDQGAYGIVHMENGELIDRVPERYLETALPKVGGNTIILTGKNQYAKGKLLERNSSKGRGVVQLFEDMNVVTVSLDDMAEWCGALDDEYDNE